MAPMADTAEHAHRRLRLAAAAFALGGAAWVHANETWQVEPHVRTAVTFTDNARLDPPGAERGDAILEVSPGLLVRSRGAHSEGRLDYTLQTITYRRLPENDRRDHLLSAYAKSEVVANLLYLDARGDRSLQTLRAGAPLEVDPALANPNRTIVDSYSFSPFARRSVGSLFTPEVRYLRDHAGSNNTALTDSDGDTLAAFVRSGPAFSRWGWGVNHANERVVYGSAGTTRRRMDSADLRFELGASLVALGTYGREDNDYPYVGEKPSGSFWSAGIKWEPSRLTRIVMNGGERFFGRTWDVDISHQARLWQWTARYKQDLSSTRAQLLLAPPSTFAYLDSLARVAQPDPLERARAIEEFIAARGLPQRIPSAVNFFGHQPFVERRFDSALVLRSARATAIAIVYRVARDVRAAGSDPNGFLALLDLSATPNVTQKGASVLMNWRFEPRTELEVDCSALQSIDRDTGFTGDTRLAQVGLRHTFGRKLVGALDYRHTWGRAQSSGAYRENALIAAINIRF